MNFNFGFINCSNLCVCCVFVFISQYFIQLVFSNMFLGFIWILLSTTFFFGNSFIPSSYILNVLTYFMPSALF